MIRVTNADRTCSLAPPDPAIPASAAPTISASEGISTGAATVATFTDPDSLAQASEYSASVDWGDGSAPSAGAITGPVGGPFTVSGSHTYGEEGSYSVTVKVADIDTANNSSVAVTHATVADAALAAAGVTGNVANSANTTVATFTDADPGGTVSDYTATIDWGDGSAATAGTVSAAGSGFSVAGTHTYPATGPFSFVVKTHVCDGAGPAAMPAAPCRSST